MTNLWGIPSSQAQEGFILARVIEEQKTNYQLAVEDQILLGQLAGKFLRTDLDRLDRPVVGDWVEVRPLWNEGKAVIQNITDRKSLLHRKASGQEQVVQPLAANVDKVFIVTSLNRDYNEKRLDRYFTIVRESGATPIVLLTKKDLQPQESEEKALYLKEKYQVECIPICSLTGDGITQLHNWLITGETSVFVGSSGVGKSTLVNALLGEQIQTIGEIRENDDRGRHTTTSRRMLRLPSGALVIDTPGMREIQLDSSHESGLDFSGLETLALHCKFSNCQHETEPGCAIKKALAEGSVSEEEYESFLKLRKEIAYQARKGNKALAAEEKKKWKAISKSLRKK